MFDENGLGKDRTQTAGTDEPENCGDQMDEENNEIAHVCIVTRQEDGRFSPNLRIRQGQAFAAAWSQGQSMTLDQAVAYALDATDRKGLDAGIKGG